jgi:predicted RNA-binding Zn-ribbon protein involved in translation (DUF1610 family)
MLHPLSLLLPPVFLTGSFVPLSSAIWSALKRYIARELKCPSCGSSSIRRVPRRGLRERLMSLIAVYPYRCDDCDFRFAARGRRRR